MFHRRGYGVPAQQHTQRVVDGFGKDVQVGNVFGTHRRKVVQTAHDPEDDRHQRKHARDRQSQTNAGEHHQQPLRVGGGNVHQAARRRAIAFGGVEPVEGSVQHLVDHVVAARDKRDRDEGEDQLPDELRTPEIGTNAERNDDPRKNEEVLDGVVKPRDGEVGTQTFGKRHLRFCNARHRRKLLELRQKRVQCRCLKYSETRLRLESPEIYDF